MPPSSSPLLPTFDQEEVESPPGEEEVDEPLRLHLVETTDPLACRSGQATSPLPLSNDFHRCALTRYRDVSTCALSAVGCRLSAVYLQLSERELRWTQPARPCSHCACHDVAFSCACVYFSS